MRRLAMIALAASLGAGAAAAEPLLGTWLTAKDDNGKSGLIEVARCGEALCGTLVKSYGPDGNVIASDHTGRKILSETMPAGEGTYEGRIYSPDRDKTYRSELELTGDRLEVSGCVMFICRDGGTWKRVD